MASRVRTPIRLMIVSTLFILWALLGCYAFYTQMTMTSVDLASLPPAQQRMWRITPDWVVYIYGLGVFAGLGGGLTLLLRMRATVALYAVSLLCVIVQFGITLIILDGIHILGKSGALLPALILLIGWVELMYARAMERRGLLV